MRSLSSYGAAFVGGAIFLKSSLADLASSLFFAVSAFSVRLLCQSLKVSPTFSATEPATLPAVSLIPVKGMASPRIACSPAATAIPPSVAILNTKPFATDSRSSKDISAYLSLDDRSEEHTSELQSRFDLVCRLLLEK